MLVLVLLRVLVCMAVAAVVIMTAAVTMLVAVLRMFVAVLIVAVLSVAVLVVRRGFSRIRFLLGKGRLEGGCYFFLGQVDCCFVNLEHELWSRLRS